MPTAQVSDNLRYSSTDHPLSNNEDINSNNQCSIPIQQVDYELIKQMCADDNLDESIDFSPHAFKKSRIMEWPDINVGGMGCHLSDIYIKRLERQEFQIQLGQRYSFPPV